VRTELPELLQLLDRQIEASQMQRAKAWPFDSTKRSRSLQ